MSDLVKTIADWPKLQERLEAHPLPAGVDDMDVSLSELAQIQGVTANGASQWLKGSDDPLPYLQQGGQGKEYVIPLSWFHAWKEGRGAEADARKRDIGKAQAAFLNMDVGQSNGGFSPKDIKELAEAKLAHAQAARMAGSLAPMEDFYQLLEGLMVDFRESSMGVSDRIERELNLSPAQTRAVETAMRDMLTSLVTKIESNQLGQGYKPNLTMTPSLQEVT